jgi:hypothetical protein
MRDLFEGGREKVKIHAAGENSKIGHVLSP